MWINLQCAESKQTTGATTPFYPFEAKAIYLHPSIPVQFYLELEEFLPQSTPDKIIIKLNEYRKIKHFYADKVNFTVP